MENTYKFKVAMTCSGKLEEVKNVDIDMENQLVTVVTSLSQDKIFETISKTGKKTEIVS
ncbi:hypothetical protein BB559_005309 [Furculomyces boomerangus]|uniref:HMA domain-containing protein n=1 Tax=Furculomyces boomerangus TaxID=61424 RepID=A0A2T9Y9E2_9FUNG|nr:hypothetical protein BB559_005309 [Furculomyces boomerangus]